jgi:hypothetical protein
LERSNAKKGIIRKAGPVSTPEEWILYKILHSKKLTSSELAQEWNNYIVEALCERREFITIATDTGELKLPLTSIFLKDSMHFEVLVADRERIQEVLSQFKSNEDFESFRSMQSRRTIVRTVVSF